MARSNENQQDAVKKLKTSILPFGFSIGLIDNDLILVEFVDELNGENVIVESIALTKNKTVNLITALQQALQEIDKEILSKKPSE